MRKELFFSVVIPAHNEEKYIENTIQHLEALDYPKESYEIIIVENASTDTTYEKAKQFASDRIHVFKLPEPGVSRARNFGSSKARSDADWVFFLDADTVPQPLFLRSLSDFLLTRAGKGYVIGTAELHPLQPYFSMKLLYFFSNLGLRLSKVANGSGLIVKRSLLDSVSFDELVAVGEDELFTREIRKHGRFFFFPTTLLHTSTRRFENGGWKKIPVWVGIWIFAIVVPYHAASTSSLQRRLKYEVVR